VPVHFAYGPANIEENGQRLAFTLLRIDRSLPMAEVIDHLDANTHHYTRAVLRNANGVLTRRLLQTMTWHGAPLVALVDPSPLAVAGDDVAFLLRQDPEATPARPSGLLPGRLPRRADVADRTNGRDPRVGEITSTELVPVATGGVFAEAVQGRANAAEIMDATRFWNWEDSPIPILPPELSPIGTGSRTRAPNLQPGQLDNPVIAVTQPRGLPDPAGVQPVLGALSAKIFRDMSGVAETAIAAKEALTQASSGAAGAGDDAAEALAKGLELTGDVVSKLIEMNGGFAESLVDGGFGLASGLGTGDATGLLGQVLSRRSGSSGTGSTGGPTASERGAVAGTSVKRDAARVVDRNRLSPPADLEARAAGNRDR
jgi:hypothetical protein